MTSVMSEPTAHSLAGMFAPRSAAVVGASPWQYNASGAAAGYIVALKEMGFPAIYPVNPKHEEVEGLRCYPSLLDIEGPVDHVISAVPAHAVLAVLDDCIAKGVHTLHLFTAGFAETDNADMAALQDEVVRRARVAGMRVLGPNCMGLYVPAAGLSFIPGMPVEPGRIAMISQSGTNAAEMVRLSAPRGIHYSKVVSYGNGADIGESELIEYLAQDDETEMIACYIEGVRDGRRLFRALHTAAQAKPVIVLKGGRTPAGGRATQSHTASLAGSAAVFSAVCRQAGAVQVRSLDEMVDMAVAFRYLGDAGGSRAALAGIGGGFSVFAADELEEAGLKCPALPEKTQAELLTFIPAAGSSVRNPIDAFVTFDPERLGKTLTVAGVAPNIDLLILQIDFSSGGFSRSPAAADPLAFMGALSEALQSAREATGVPVIVVARPAADPAALENTLLFQERCWQAGVPIFPTISRAANAISRVLSWHAEREDARAATA